MWTIIDSVNNATNKVTVPIDGIISVTKPDSVRVNAYVNDSVSAVHHVHVKAGDVVYFELHNTAVEGTDIVFDYAGASTLLKIPGAGTDSTYSAEGKTMAEEMNYFGGGMGAGAGAGLGAGILGGLLSSQLLRNNRDGVGDSGVVTPALLASSLATNANVTSHDAILQTLGDIKAAVPVAEGQIQLALAGAQADINRNTTSGTSDIVAGQAGINKNVSDAIASSLASQATIRAEALVAAGALQAAILNSKFELSNTVRDDGDKTRALIVAQNEATLNRELTVAQSALLEARAVGREQNNSINITNTMTQNQAQAQLQAQQQQQFQILANLNAAVVNLANDIQVVRQTQSNVNFGVQGNAGQTASAANNRVN